MKIKFNVNDRVWVQLTDFGRYIHRRNHDMLYAGGYCPYEYKPPEEDSKGWSRWQLWSLMGEFGEDMKMGGMSPPFKTTIKLEAPDGQGA